MSPAQADGNVRFATDAQRRKTLYATLAALNIESRAPAPRELALVHRWLDNWNGVGLILAGQRAVVAVAGAALPRSARTATSELPTTRRTYHRRRCVHSR